MILRCECGNKLGEIIAGHYIIRHRRREIVAERVESMRCERCGRIWQPEPPEDQRELLGEGRSEG